MQMNTQQLYRYQKPGDPNRMSRQQSERISRILPNINKTQLKEIILGKYRKEFGRNSAKLGQIEQIIDSNLENVRNINDQVFQIIKEQIKEQVGDYQILRTQSMANISISKSANQTPMHTSKHNKSILPEINSNKNQNSSKINLQELEQKYGKKKKDKENEKGPQTERQLDNKSKEQQYDAKKPSNTEASQQESVSEQIEKIKQQSKMQIDTEKLKAQRDDLDSVRSLYEINDMDEWTAIIKKDTQKFEQDKLEKKKILKERQLQMRKQLDQQVKQNQILLNRKKKESKTQDHILNQQQVQQYDQEQMEKKQKHMKLIEQMQQERDKQIQYFTEKQQNRKQHDDDINKSIVQNASQSFNAMEEAKRRKRQKEYEFYQKVKEEDTQYKQTEGISIDKNDPTKIFTSKRFQKINAVHSSAYNLNRKANNLGMNDYFERNKAVRVQDQNNRQKTMDSVLTPLSVNFKTVDKEKEKEETRQYYQNIFKNTEKEIQMEELKKFKLKMKHREEINRDLDKQIHEIERKKEQEKQDKLNYASYQNQSNEQFQNRQRGIDQQKRERNNQLQEYLKLQAEQQKLNKKGFVKMSDEELLMNKSELKQFTQQSPSTVTKRDITDYKHMIRQI